jgi:hypothetical protein
VRPQGGPLTTLLGSDLRALAIFSSPDVRFGCRVLNGWNLSFRYFTAEDLPRSARAMNKSLLALSKNTLWTRKLCKSFK